MTDDYQSLVRAIINENHYMTIATTDGRHPWLAPVQFCSDDALNFYFVSLPGSRHARHIAHNPEVGIAIFDSGQKPFTGRGIQVEGLASLYSDSENPFATIGGSDMPSNLSDVAPGYVAFRVEPRHFYVPRGYLEGGLGDERVEIKMV